MNTLFFISAFVACVVFLVIGIVIGRSLSKTMLLSLENQLKTQFDGEKQKQVLEIQSLHQKLALKEQQSEQLEKSINNLKQDLQQNTTCLDNLRNLHTELSAKLSASLSTEQGLITRLQERDSIIAGLNQEVVVLGKDKTSQQELIEQQKVQLGQAQEHQQQLALLRNEQQRKEQNLQVKLEELTKAHAHIAELEMANHKDEQLIAAREKTIHQMQLDYDTLLMQHEQHNQTIKQQNALIGQAQAEKEQLSQLQGQLQHKDQYIQKELKVWVKLNSGMNRLGFKIDAIKNVIHQLKAEGFTCVLAMHFANADADHPLNNEQIRQFLNIKNDCAPILASCCNSAAIYKYPELHFDFVRPGIMLYGATPFADRNIHDLDLKPVMTFTSEVIALNQIQAGEAVGYGSNFVADQPMQLAIVSIGYGDGYPRAFPKQNYVAIHGQLTRVIGRVAMDMIAIDVTDLKAEIGTEVELWGTSRLVDDVAEANGTIGYELLCRLSQRPQRKKI